MHFLRISALIALLIATAGFTPLPPPSPGDRIPRDYARLCNPVNTPSIALPQDASIERSASEMQRRPLHLVIVWPARHKELTVNSHAILTDADQDHPQWFDATLDATAKISAISIATPQAKRIIGFFRFMSAYEYLNELLQADGEAKDRCASTFAKAFSPIFARLLSDAVDKPGPTTPNFAASVRHAFATFEPRQTTSWDSATWTLETRQRLGSAPAVNIVYRDRGLPGDGVPEIDIVRLGSTTYTYVMVMVSASKMEVAVSPVCIMGDHRCAAAYVWP